MDILNFELTCSFSDMRLIFLCLCTVVSVRAVIDDRSLLGLTDFPTDIPVDVTILKVDQNYIDYVPPEALQGLPVLFVIDLSDNGLTVFPDLTAVANSLEILEIYLNNIAIIDGALLEALYKLTRLDLSDNDLAVFPTLTSGPCYSLTYLNLSQNPLVSTPSFVQYTILSWLLLSNTDLKQAPAVGEGVTLTMLELDNTAITEISVEFMSKLSVETLIIMDSPVALLPSPCVADLSDVILLATPPLPVCECRHVWLKAAVEMGAAIDVGSDPLCSGNLWSTSSMAELLDACWVTPDGKSFPENNLLGPISLCTQCAPKFHNKGFLISTSFLSFLVSIFFNEIMSVNGVNVIF